MKRLGIVLSLLLAWSAAAVHVRFSPVDSTGRPVLNRPFYLYPLDAPFSSGTNQVSRDRIATNTGPAGSLTISNLVGQDFRTELVGIYTTTTNWWQFPITNGLIDATADCLSAPTNSNQGTAILDARYWQRAVLAAGSNVVFYTNSTGQVLIGGQAGGGSGSGVTNNQVLPGTPTATNLNAIGTFSGYFYGVDAGLTNASGVGPWHSGEPGDGVGLTNASGLTSSFSTNAASAGVRGKTNSPFYLLSDAVAQSGAGDILLIRSGWQMTNQVSLSNLNISADAAFTAGHKIYSTNAGHSSDFSVWKCGINSLNITNTSAGNVDIDQTVVNLLGGGSHFYNCVIGGPNVGVGTSGIGLSSANASYFTQCTISAPVGMDLWHDHFYVNHSTITSSIYCLSPNDWSVVRADFCEFIVGGNTDDAIGSMGVLAYVWSQAEFVNCVFLVNTNLGVIHHNAIIIAMSEPAQSQGSTLAGASTYAAFKNCAFSLAYSDGGWAQLASFNSPTSGGVWTLGTLVLEHCTYSPETNGVIVDNGPYGTVYVNGGNLKPWNFSYPTNVHFLNSITVTSGLIAPGTNYVTFPHGLGRTPDWTTAELRVISQTNGSEQLPNGDSFPVEDIAYTASTTVLAFATHGANSTNAWISLIDFVPNDEGNWQYGAPDGTPHQPSNFRNWRVVLKAGIYPQ